MQSPIRPIGFLMVAELFERMAYYGVRSIFVLFLTQTLLWDRMQAVEWYGTVTMIVYIASVVGGLAADLSRLPALMAIIGNSLTTLGIFGLAFSGSDMVVYSSGALIAFGSGMYKPSVVAALYRASFTVKHRFDFIFTIFYVAINIGAFMGPPLIAGFGDTVSPEDFRTGFIVAGCISLIPTALIALNYKYLVYNDLIYNNQTNRLNDLSITSMVLWFLVSIIFWVGYELYQTYNDVFSSTSLAVALAFMGLAMYIVVLPLNLIRSFRPALKIAIGLALVALTSSLLPILNAPPGAGLLVLTIAEVLVAPILMSQIVQNASPRFTATIMGAFMFVTVFTNKLAATLSNAAPAEQPFVQYLISLLCLVFLAALLVIDQIQKKREQSAQFPSY